MYPKRTAIAVVVLIILVMAGCATFRDDFDLEQMRPLAVAPEIKDALRNRKGLDVCMGEVTFYDSGPLHQILKERKIKEGAFSHRAFPLLKNPDQMTRDMYGRVRGALSMALAEIGFRLSPTCGKDSITINTGFAFLFKEKPSPQAMLVFADLNLIYKGKVVLVTGTGWQGRLDAPRITPEGVSLLIRYVVQKHMREMVILWPKTFGPPG